MKLDPRAVALALGGDVSRRNVVAPGPGHSRSDRSLSIKIDPAAPDGFVVHSFAGDPAVACREYVRAALGLTSSRSRRFFRSHAHSTKLYRGGNGDRTAYALRWWHESASLPGTLGERYLVERRGLPIGKLSDMSHALRWHSQRRCIVALMTDPNTAAPTGVHRTFIASDGSRLDRKMLGPQGVVRLSADEDVTLGLGLTEGVEDGLGVLLAGWWPVWAATSAGAIQRFPVLPGIEALTVFADADAVGMTAAEVCAARWLGAGQEATILPPHHHGGGNA
jgi:putative DNA primase/helicase